MLLFYTTCIRRILEYACPVFHNALPQYLSNDMERLQKRARSILHPDLSYTAPLVAAGITSMYERRQALNEALFDQIMGNPSHKLHELLPSRNECTYCLSVCLSVCLSIYLSIVCRAAMFDFGKSG